MGTKLTPADLDLLGRARDLAELNEDAAGGNGYADAFGKAQYLLARLADLAERLAGEQ